MKRFFSICFYLVVTAACSTQTGETVSSDIPDDPQQDAAGDAEPVFDLAFDSGAPDTGLDSAVDAGTDLWEEQCVPGEGCFLDPCQEASWIGRIIGVLRLQAKYRRA